MAEHFAGVDIGSTMTKVVIMNEAVVASVISMSGPEHRKLAEEIVENGGGRFALQREVSRIIVKHGCAVGVQVIKASAKGGAEEEQYFAPVVVSNAGAAETYLNLIPDDQPIPFRDEIKRFFRDNPPTTNMALFLGLSKDPREFDVNGTGLNGANLWIYDRLDHDEIFALRSTWFDNGSPGHAPVHRRFQTRRFSAPATGTG